ncbi:MAG TPA: hypothetical protein VJO35_01650 [Terriglobales bacterium]|nr:hypothetical protein [Terriglobales bacterium]
MKDYRKVVDDARKQTETARAASDRHSRDLAKMKRVAEDARESLQQSQARQRSREATVLTIAA